MNDLTRDMGHEINMDPISNRETITMNRQEKKAMNTHALLNINELVDLINQNKIEELKDKLEILLSESHRAFVLGDQEMMQATAAIVHDLSVTPKSDLTDKMTRIFWYSTQRILEKHAVI